MMPEQCTYLEAQLAGHVELHTCSGSPELHFDRTYHPQLDLLGQNPLQDVPPWLPWPNLNILPGCTDMDIWLWRWSLLLIRGRSNWILPWILELLHTLTSRLLHSHLSRKLPMSHIGVIWYPSVTWTWPRCMTSNRFTGWWMASNHTIVVTPP